jgi:hypothetical protein
VPEKLPRCHGDLLQSEMNLYVSFSVNGVTVSDMNKNKFNLRSMYTRGNKNWPPCNANGRSGGTVVTISLLFTYIMILLTFRLPTHLEQTKSVCAIIYLYVKKIVLYLNQ